MNKFLAGSIVSTIMFFFSAAQQAQAMEMAQFDKMSPVNQGNYEGFLVAGVAELLNDQNNLDAKQKNLDFFLKVPAGGKVPLGTVQFVKNLAIVRVINQRNANDPSKEPLKVEHAFFAVLKANGIHVSVDDLLTIGAGFKPDTPSGNPQ